MKTDVFLISGDPFLRAQKVRALAVEIEQKAGGVVSHQTYDLDETPLEHVLAAARTLPFFSSGQVIHIQGAESLKEPDLAVLAAYLDRPGPQTTLIFEADDLKGSAELQKVIKSRGQVILLAKEEARGAGAQFIQEKLAQSRKTMTSGAKTRILAMCGDAVMFLDTMLERLVRFAGDKKEIDEDMVNQFDENWTEMDVFKLTNALVERDPARTLKVFRDLVEIYEADIYSLTGILHWQLRQLWQAAMLLNTGMPEREICSKLRMPPVRLSMLKRFPLERLESAIEELYQFDKKLKTGQVEDVAGMEAWLLEHAV